MSLDPSGFWSCGRRLRLLPRDHPAPIHVMSLLYRSHEVRGVSFTITSNVGGMLLTPEQRHVLLRLARVDEGWEDLGMASISGPAGILLGRL